jgi:RimJ/RimL family protein N-acetyltransferase
MMDALLLDFPQQFETRRLTIRCPLPGDGPELNKAILESWESLAQWMPWATERPTVQESEHNVRRACLRFLAREDLRLSLFIRGTETLVGSSGLHRIDWEVPKFEIGYWVRKRYERQGLITEAVEGITRFAFQELEAKRVEIRCDTKNERSMAIPNRLGFALEGTLHNDGRDHVTGELRDTLVFSKTTL